MRGEGDREYEFAEDAIVVRERVREGDEDNDFGGVRRIERALYQLVKHKGAACLHAVLDYYHFAAKRPCLAPLLHS